MDVMFRQKARQEPRQLMLFFFFFFDNGVAWPLDGQTVAMQIVFPLRKDPEIKQKYPG
jgi:hypothetical protein